MTLSDQVLALANPSECDGGHDADVLAAHHHRYAASYYRDALASLDLAERSQRHAEHREREAKTESNDELT